MVLSLNEHGIITEYGNIAIVYRILQKRLETCNIIPSDLKLIKTKCTFQDDKKFGDGENLNRGGCLL